METGIKGETSQVELRNGERPTNRQDPVKPGQPSVG